jgi:hypothetical protein
MLIEDEFVKISTLSSCAQRWIFAGVQVLREESRSAGRTETPQKILRCAQDDSVLGVAMWLLLARFAYNLV